MIFKKKKLPTLEELRKAGGYTQREIAVHCGVSYTAYQKWSSGLSKPNDENLEKLEKVLPGSKKIFRRK
jgi:transcriptional regulator with XRE-family HTH domain